MSAGDGVHGGVRWMAVAVGATRAAAFITNIVVGYFVTEGEYGVVALAIAVLLILSAMRESGLGQALVREDGLDADGERRAANTVFWILFASNTVLAGLAWLAAPTFAEAVADSPLLLPILRVVVCLLVVDTFLTVPRFLLLRRMQFSRLAGAQGVAAAAQAAVAIGAAWGGAGAWSLIYGQIVLRVVQAALSLRAARWFPAPVFDAGLAAQLFRFGKWLWAFTIINAIGNRLDRFLLGSRFGEATVGIYAMALTICQIPVKQIANVVQSVAFPAFSRMTDRDRMADAFVRGSRMLSAVCIPAALGLHATAPAFVDAVLDDKWAPCVPVIQVLAFHGLLLSIATATGPLLNATGRSRTTFFIGFVEQLIVTVLLFTLAQHGILWVAGSMVVAMVWSVCASYTAVLRVLALPASAVFAPMIRLLVAGVAMEAAVLGIDMAWWNAFAGAESVGLELVRLVVLVTAGVLVYAVAVMVVERRTARELLRFGARVAGVGRRSAGDDSVSASAP